MTLHPRLRAHLRCLAPAWLLALAACGGSDDPPAPTLAAADDSVTAPWNAPVTVDVLANDMASAGAKALTAVTTPAHGSAAIVAGKLVYTPAAGFFGSDTVRYTARAGDGGATAQADVNITVQAALTLSGIVSDAPLAGAAVSVKVGTGSSASTATATADAAGLYSVPVVTANPAAFVRIEARGAGAASAVRLVSLAGDAASLAALADGAGKVAHTQADGLTVSHFSTAGAALMSAGSAGEPATSAALAAARAKLDSAALLDRATLIYLVAHGAAALPAGIADTWSLVLNAAATAVMIEANRADDVFSQARDAALQQAPPLPLPLPTTAPRTSIAYVDIGGSAGATQLTLDPAGTAQVVDGEGERAATWTALDGVLRVVFSAPVVTDGGVDAEIDPVTGQQEPISFSRTGFVLRMAAPSLARVTPLQTQTWLGGSRLGETLVVSGPDDTGSLDGLVADPETAAALAPDTIAVGTRLAGIDVRQADTPDSLRNSDVLLMTAVGVGRAERLGVVYAVSLNGARLRLAGNDGSTRDYQRLRVNADTGIEHWAITEVAAAGSRKITSGVMVAVPPSFSVDVAAMARVWRWDIPESSFRQPVDFELRADGSGLFFGSTALTWSLGGDGHVRIVRMAGTSTANYDWIPLKRVGNRLFVLRNLSLTRGEDAPPDAAGKMWFMHTYIDNGPATP
jgi:hypothetical protein